MLEAAQQAYSYLEGLDEEEFLVDKRTQQAVIPNLIIIGEASTKLLKDYSQFFGQHPDVPWRSMRAMRNRIAHGYFEIDLDVVGAAGLVAGAMSMAAGEYVSVSSQVDTEQADLRRESKELAENPYHEEIELKAIYIDRGLEPELAQQVAEQLMVHDALAAHARDELGITGITTARPLQAAIVSTLTFSLGAFLPLSMIMLFPYIPLANINQIIMDITGLDTMPLIAIVGSISLLSLILLGGLSALTGGASVFTAIARVTFWGMLSMVITASVGLLFGTVSG
jgi:VIT1/CCC1 family predicted Fe2+/Mn2+ transporter